MAYETKLSRNVSAHYCDGAYDCLVNLIPTTSQTDCLPYDFTYVEYDDDDYVDWLGILNFFTPKNYEFVFSNVTEGWCGNTSTAVVLDENGDSMDESELIWKNQACSTNFENLDLGVSFTTKVYALGINLQNLGNSTSVSMRRSDPVFKTFFTRVIFKSWYDSSTKEVYVEMELAPTHTACCPFPDEFDTSHFTFQAMSYESMCSIKDSTVYLGFSTKEPSSKEATYNSTNEKWTYQVTSLDESCGTVLNGNRLIDPFTVVVYPKRTLPMPDQNATTAAPTFQRTDISPAVLLSSLIAPGAVLVFVVYLFSMLKRQFKKRS